MMYGSTGRPRGHCIHGLGRHTTPCYSAIQRGVLHLSYILEKEQGKKERKLDMASAALLAERNGHNHGFAGVCGKETFKHIF